MNQNNQKEPKSSSNLISKKDATDTFVLLSTAGLDAAGLGSVASIWESFFPQGDPEFSEMQLQQITQVFEEVFGQANYQQYVTQFNSYTVLVGEYAKNPVPAQLPDIIDQTQVIADQIFQQGYVGAKAYVAAAALNLVALSYAYDEASPGNKPGAQQNIGDKALLVLNNLLTLEDEMFQAQGLEFFSAFKGYTQFNDMGDSISGAYVTSALGWYGTNYRDAVISLIQKVQSCTLDSFSQIQAPAYVLKFFPYDQNIMVPIWSAQDCPTWKYPITFYTCNLIPSEENYFPLGDLGIPNGLPSTVPYIRNYSLPTQIAHNPPPPSWSYSQIYNDGGSGNPNDYAAYNFAWAPWCDQLSTMNGDNDASTPDPQRISLFAVVTLTTQELGESIWDDTFTGADEDCIVYAHPQFGSWGLYNLFRSHSRPDNDFVNCIKEECFKGHPVYC